MFAQEFFKNAEKVEMVKKINTMLHMQEELDKEILKSKHTGAERDVLNLRLAILDEVGELNHELKKKWCWWKESQDNVDTMKVWEELIDIWHFVMSGYIDEVKNDETLSVQEILDITDHKAKAFKDHGVYRYEFLIWSLLQAMYFNEYSLALSSLILVGGSLGFDIDDVYYKYMDKNAENYMRAHSDY